jgi:hypothetical protein
MLTAGTGSPAYLQMRGGAANPQIACALNTGSNCSILFKPQGTGGLNFQNGNGGDSIEILGTSVSPGDTLQYVPNNAGPAVFTASIGAMFTGAGSGTSITVTPISGVIHPGSASTATITGTGVPGSTYIVSQTSGIPGGAGVYVTNNPTTSSGASITSTSTTMDVTGTTSGTIAVGQSDSGLGIASGTMLTALISGGGTGGVGTYTISPAQYAPSTTATALGSTVTLQTSNSAPITLNPSLALAGAVSFNNNGIAATTQQKLQSAFNVTGIDSDVGQQVAGIFNINANFQNSTNFASAPPAMSVISTQLGTGYARGITGLQIFANLTSTPTNVPSTWATTTTYGNGSMMYDASADLFQTFTGGTTGSIEPTLTNCKPSCTDGTVTWTYTGASLYGIAGTVASQVYGEINANQGGTAAATMGTGWGLLGGVIVGAGGTYTQAVTAQELDINVAPTGAAAPGSLVGLGIYTQAAGQGRFVDTALSIAGNTGNYRQNGIQFGSTLDPNAGVGLSVYDSRGNAQYGAGLIDCSQCGHFAGTRSQFGNDAPFILKSPYFDLLTTGDMRLGYGLIHVTSNGFTLDVPNYAVTGNSGFSGGTGWINGEEACDALGNCGTITQSGGVPSGIAVYTDNYIPSSSVPGATPVTWHAVSISSPGPTGGTTEGTPFTTVETYVQATSPTIGIGGVSATAINIGNSGSTTTVAGTLGVTGAISQGGVALGSAAFKNTGTSGATVPLLNVANSWQAAQTFNQPMLLTTTNSRFELSSTSAAFTQTAANTCPAGNTLWCVQGVFGGTITGSTNMASMLFQDTVNSTGNSDAFSIIHNIAPNGNIASGPRVTLDVAQTQVSGGAQFTGTISGGTSLAVSGVTGTIAVGQPLVYPSSPAGLTILSGSGSSWVLSASATSVGPIAMLTTNYTSAGVSDVMRLTGFMQSTLGGSPVFHQGALTTLNVSCQSYATATNIFGCADVEFDLGAYTGSSSFQQNTFAMFVLTGNDAQEGQMGPSLGLLFAAQANTSAIGLNTLLQIGSTASQFPMSAFGRIIAIEPSYNRSSSPTVTGSFLDAALMTYHGFVSRQPFTETVSLRASGITSATRLTSDGLAANGYIADAVMVAQSSGYLVEPSWTVTGCTGAVLHSTLGGGGAIGQVGVYTPGTACIAGATAAVSTGTATVALLIAGNTLNLPINSTNDIECHVAAQDASSHNIGWSIEFGVTMGATSSTTAIVGSPTWTQAFASSGAGSDISISAPAADTTLGAANLTITPSAGTWNVGGFCTITSTQQII